MFLISEFVHHSYQNGDSRQDDYDYVANEECIVMQCNQIITGRKINFSKPIHPLTLWKKHEFVVVTDPIQNGGQIGGKFKTGGFYVSSAYFFN